MHHLHFNHLAVLGIRFVSVDTGRALVLTVLRQAVDGADRARCGIAAQGRRRGHDLVVRWRADSVVCAGARGAMVRRDDDPLGSHHRVYLLVWLNCALLLDRRFMNSAPGSCSPSTPATGWWRCWEAAVCWRSGIEIYRPICRYN